MRDLLGGLACTLVLIGIVCILGMILTAFDDSECVMCNGTGRWHNVRCFYCD